jgi:thiamine-monophosphate kinase
MTTEKDFINDIKSKYNLNLVGDDCAVIPKSSEIDMVVTADMLVEDIDFRLDWTDPFLLGRKALTVSLSDIAAMGATPCWAMLSIAIPDGLWKEDFLKVLYEGWHSQARKYGMILIGGDISRSPDKLVIDSVVIGEAPRGKALLRSGARPGDLIYVSGTLGGAAGGLRLLESGDRFDKTFNDARNRLIKKQLDPEHQLTLGNLLLSDEISSAAIDVSDGFSTDVFHICEMSAVGCVIHGDLLPIDPDLLNIFGDEEAFEMALNGGEDFQLIFTVPPEKEGDLDVEGITKVGEITSASKGIKLTRNGEHTDLRPDGFKHF